MTGLPVSIDVSAIPPDPGGAGRYVLNIVGALAQRDEVALHLVARADDGDRWRAVAPSAEVDAVAPRHRPARLAWEQLRLPRRLRRMGVAVHHAPHYTMPEAAAVPCVVTIHDLTFFEHPEWHERTKAPFFRRAVRVAARHAAALVCVSHATATKLAGLCDPVAPVHVIPHGVDHARFRPTEEHPGDDAARLAALGVRPPFAVFVGTIEPRKGVAVLVRAFDRIASRHPELQLVIAGGAGWGGALLDDALAGIRHAGRVVRTGYIPDEEVAALLRTASAVAYPSLEEGFGLPALEALACGAPLVTTTGSAMEETARDAALFVPPGDADALAGALDMLVRVDEGRAARRARGFEIAARHTWEASAAAHVAVYREAAGRAGPRR